MHLLGHDAFSVVLLQMKKVPGAACAIERMPYAAFAVFIIGEEVGEVN